MQKIKIFFLFIGIDLKKLIRSPINTINFFFQFFRFKIINDNKKFSVKLKNILPEYNINDHEFTHYFYQDIEVAKIILNSKPKNHLDVGSKLEGFIAHLLCFMKVHYLDIRPLKIKNSNLMIINNKANDMTDINSNSFESISSLHAMETFGLGRYGDKLNSNIEKEFFDEIYRVLKVKGKFYLSVPLGNNIVYFNSHKTYDPNFILKINPNFKLKQFFVIKNNGDKMVISDIQNYKSDNNFNLGIFIFEK